MDVDSSKTITFQLNYANWKNAKFAIEPNNLLNPEAKYTCVEHVWAVPKGGKVSLPNTVNQERFCNARSVDFSPYLRDGENQIIIEVHSYVTDVELYISPQLFAAHWLPALISLALFATTGSIVFLIARNMELDVITAALAAMACCYYALWLHLRPNLTYTNDLPGHMEYIRYLIQHWTQPYEHTGAENFHPPSYYYLAAPIFGFFSTSGVVNPLSAVRVLSLGFYMTFCLYGLRTLREAIEKKGWTYYMGALLIAFWPVGINLATNINNDIAIYAAWGVSFYYLARWFGTQDLHCFHIAIVTTGLALMIKSSAVVLAGVTGGCALYALLIGRLSLSDLLRRDSIIAFSILFLELIINAGKLIYLWVRNGYIISDTHFGSSGPDFHPWDYFVRFDFRDFIEHPFVTFLNEPDFLNFFIKTMLYGEPGWQHSGLLTSLPALLNIMLLGLLILTCVGTTIKIIKAPRSASNLAPYLIGALASLAGSVAFMVIEHYQFCQNFRYVLPMLVPLVILYVYSLEAIRNNAILWPLYWLGLIIGTCLPVGAVILYGTQY